MNKRTLGILAGVVGSAVGAWWLNRQRFASKHMLEQAPKRDHGTVIYHNTPTAMEGDAI